MYVGKMPLKEMSQHHRKLIHLWPGAISTQVASQDVHLHEAVHLKSGAHTTPIL
jgi:hypothetical protein